MALSRDKYVPNSSENIDKLIRKVMEVMDIDALRREVHLGLVRHYVDNDQCFVEDYYETFPDEDPELNGMQEEAVIENVIYYHGHHSNPCVVGGILIPRTTGIEVVIITHNMICEDYDDNLCDITKVWDAHVQSEILGFDRYDTDYDSCIHIPLNLGEHTTLANQVLKQILIDNNVEFVTLSGTFDNQVSLEEFSGYLKNV